MTLIEDIDWSESFDVSECDSATVEKCIPCLQTNFGHSNFREMQWKVISSILNEKRDNCVIMSTGYGKSLCYQFPSVYLNTITIVVSPLISLMQDQVLAMEINNVRACFLGSAQQNHGTMNEIIDRKYNIVYVTPEYITSEVGEYLLKRITECLTLIAIDEAHCISKWGHDFRPAYQKLSRLRNLCPEVPILTMTATATPIVKADIIQSLQLREVQVISTSFDRPNLQFAVRQKSNIWADIGHHIRNVKIGSVIVYCITRRMAEEVASTILSHGHLCAIYHAGLSLTQRKRTHEDFIHDRIRVICATVAFGMGINKPDVRLVIHYGVAKDVESYYQEVGRAGRDGLPSKCLMFYEQRDWILYKMINKSLNLQELVNQENLMQVMREYAISTECRRRFILNYFGENCEHLQHRSNCCDNCDRPSSVQNLFNLYEGLCEDGLLDITNESMKILTVVRDGMNKFGSQKVILILKGSKSKSLPSHWNRHSLYGSLSHKPQKWLEAVCNYLYSAGFLQMVQCKLFTLCKITQKGIDQLSKMSPIKIIPTDEFIRLLKIKANGLPKILVDKQIANSNKSARVIAKKIPNIYRPLLQARTKLASLFDVMPYLVASEKALHQLATSQPTTMDELRRLELDGFSEEKITRFGPVFLKIIKDFHTKNGKTLEKLPAESKIMKHLILKKEIDPVDQPSTSSNNIANCKQEPESHQSTPTEVCYINCDVEILPSPSPEEENKIPSSQDSVDIIEPSPPPIVEISDDSNTEPEDEEYDEDEELNVLMAALKEDKQFMAKTNRSREDNEKPIVSDNNLQATENNSIAKEVLDNDIFDECWDDDIDDLDLSYVSEKTEQEMQAKSAVASEDTHLSNNATKCKIEQEDVLSELDLFLDEVKLDFSQNNPFAEASTSIKKENNVRVIQKKSNVFQYEDDFTSDSDEETVIPPKKRVLPSWMQLTNKRKR